MANQEMFELDELDRPTSLLGAGHHFTDLPGGRRPVETAVLRGRRTPMQRMIELFDKSGLRRPAVPKRRIRVGKKQRRRGGRGVTRLKEYM